jgi:hypothetical protein
MHMGSDDRTAFEERDDMARLIENLRRISDPVISADAIRKAKASARMARNGLDSVGAPRGTKARPSDKGHLWKRGTLVAAIAVCVAGMVFGGMTWYGRSRIIVKTMAGSIAHHYGTLDELIRDAGAILVVDVGSGETIEYIDTPFTLTEVKVARSIRGDLKAGDVITIIETGGYVKQADGTTFDYRFDGIPVLRFREKVLLFLKRFEGPQTDDAYIPLGVFQGKFLIEGDRLQQQVPEGAGLAESVPEDLDAFIAAIEGN